MENASAQAQSPAIDQVAIVSQPKKKSRKILYLFLLVGIVALLIAVFLFRNYVVNSSQKSKSNEQVYAGQIENIRVGNVGVYTIFNLIAKEQGFFVDHGLNVDLTEFSSGPESVGGLIAGKTDINIGADFVGVRNIFDHPELRILAQVNQHRIFQLAAKKDKIASFAELKGKKIGVTKNSAGEYFLGNFLAKSNMSLEDVTRVNLAPLDMITQVENDTLDAMVVFEPHVYNLAKKLGDNFVSWDVQGDQNISALVYTTQAFIDKNPDVIKRYIVSLVDAEKYYLTHMTETKEMVAEKFGYEKEYVEYSWPKLTHSITLNQELLLGMEDEARWTIEHKLTDKTEVPNYLEYIYFDGLSAVKPQAVTIIR